MIPTLMLFGLLFGRWWRVSVLVAAVGWPVALVLTDVMGLEPGLAGAAVLAVGNTVVGVLVHQGSLWGLRRARSQHQPPVPTDHSSR